MKIQPQVTITFTRDEITNIVLDAIPAKYTGWVFHINVQPDGSVVCAGEKSQAA